MSSPISESLIGNKTTDVDNGKLDNKLFDQFVNVIETGEPLNMIFQHQQTVRTGGIM